MIYTFLLFSLTILVGFLSIPIYDFNHEINYSHIYISDQNYLGETYSSALEVRQRNLAILRLLLRGFGFLLVFRLLLKSPIKLKRNKKSQSNPLVLVRKLKRILIMKQNTGVYKDLSPI